MTRALALAISVALVGPALAGPAAAATTRRPAKGKVARPARKAAVRPLGERAAKNDRLIASLERKKSKAEAKATREVTGWSETKLAGFGFRPQQREKAAKVRSSMLFGRNDKRLLTTAKIVKGLLAAEGAAASAGERAALQEQQATLMRSGWLNRKLGTERQVPLQIKRFLQLRFPRLAQRIWFLRRDTVGDPGTIAGNLGAIGDAERTDHLDPVASTMWEPRKPERITTEALFAGPWMKAEKRPTLPESESVLELESFRSLDADGIHPSVFVTDPATGTEWKVKFLGGPENPLSPEPAMSRVYYALGYHASPVYHVAELRMDARAVIAAYQHQQKVGFRVREGSILHRIFRLKPGKYGHTAFKMRNQIKNVRFRGKLLSGDEAVRVLEDAQRDPSLLEHISYVTVHGVDIALKGEGGGESIGPFHPDDPGNVDRREMRGLSMISAVWGMGDDVRFNNLRLDAEVGDDGTVELEHVQSDAGAHFLTEKGANALAWEVDIDLNGARLHNDQNRITLDAFDRTTLDDARWAARKLAGLSEQQIVAMVASSAESWPVARLYAEKLIARRDDMVKKLGLDGELGLLRPDGPDRHLNVSGRGRVTLTDAAGAKRNVIIPAGKYDVVDGQVVPQ
jgi:hypothetical protein